MPLSSSLQRLAEAAHAVWCESMQEQGWRRGVGYDENALLHDALVPFAELHPADRRSALSAAQFLAGHVLRELRYARGHNREFTGDDIRVGMQVKLGAGSRFRQADDQMAGKIVAWENQPDSVLLKSIQVRWEDGSETQHDPAMCDLYRL